MNMNSLVTPWNESLDVSAPARAPALVETDLASLDEHLDGLFDGRLSAVLIKRVASDQDCSRIFDNFMRSPGLYQRSDGVSGRMVGTNAFMKDTAAMLLDYLRNNGYAELLFEGANNVFRLLYDAIEDAGHRFRPAYINGVPSPTHRATIWDDSCIEQLVLKAHTDWPQVRHSGREYSDVTHPIAVNFYPRHPDGKASCVRLYDLVPTAHWLRERGIHAGGYPIDFAELHEVPYLDIVPSSGDMLLFAAANVHSVFQARGHASDVRLNINGFIGYSRRANRVLAWV
ncbi:MAG: hypothetical protein AB7E72_13615 [Lysobacterales bacterium]